MNNSLPRIYLPNIASDACPVCCRIFHDDTPDRAALVASPARVIRRIDTGGDHSSALTRKAGVVDAAIPDVLLLGELRYEMEGYRPARRMHMAGLGDAAMSML